MTAVSTFASSLVPTVVPKFDPFRPPNRASFPEARLIVPKNKSYGRSVVEQGRCTTGVRAVLSIGNPSEAYAGRRFACMRANTGTLTSTQSWTSTSDFDETGPSSTPVGDIAAWMLMSLRANSSAQMVGSRARSDSIHQPEFLDPRSVDIALGHPNRTRPALGS
jgi:hypothetical protein